MKYDFAIVRGLIEGALFAGLLLALVSCAGTDTQIARLAAAQCPNGVNDSDAHRDASGRLHVQAGCD